MSDEVEVKKETNKNAEAADYRLRYKKVRDERNNALQEIGVLTKDIASLREQLNNLPNEYKEENEKLKGQIRNRTHIDAFTELSAGKIKPNAIKAAFSLSGWTVDSDEVDKDKMSEAITKLIEENDFLKLEETKSPESEGVSDSPQGSRLSSPSGLMPKPVSGLGKGLAAYKSENVKPRRTSL